VLLWLTALLPIALLFAYDQLIGPIFVGRYLLFAVPLLCVLAGGGLTALRLPVALAAVVALGVVGLPLQSEVRKEHSPFDYRAAAAVVDGNEQPGDGIVYAPRGGWQLVDTGLEYYLRDRAPRDVLLAESETQDASLWATECADPAACIRGVTRVWVVAADNLNPAFRANATNQLTKAQAAALRAYTRQRSWRVDGFTITLFTVRPAAA
jgi:mannosyltransferase